MNRTAVSMLRDRVIADGRRGRCHLSLSQTKNFGSILAIVLSGIKRKVSVMQHFIPIDILLLDVDIVLMPMLTVREKS